MNFFLNLFYELIENLFKFYSRKLIFDYSLRYFAEFILSVAEGLNVTETTQCHSE